MSDILNIAGRIHSISEEGIVTTASEIKDEGVNKSQSTINAEVQSELGNQSAAIDALENQNYVNISATNSDTIIEDVFTRLDITPSADTIYRVANWKYDATTKYNTSYFSEYSVNISGSTVTYVPLMVVNLGIDSVPVAGSENLVQSGGVVPVSNLESDLVNRPLSADQGKVIADATMVLVVSENLLDPETITQGTKIIRKDYGTEYTVASAYGYTDFFELPETGSLICNSSYKASGVVGGAVYYRSDKTFIANAVKGASDNGGPVVVSRTDNEGAVYVKFNLYANTDNQYAVYKGSTLPEEFIPYVPPYYKMKEVENNSIGEEKLKDGAVTESKLGADVVTTAKIKDDNVTLEKVEFKETVIGKNLVDVSKMKNGYYYSNGSWIDSGSSYKCSPLIAVEAGASYHLSMIGDRSVVYGHGSVYTCFYSTDSTSSFISNIDSNTKQFQVPQNANYVAFTVQLSQIPSGYESSYGELQLEKGTSRTEYESYNTHEFIKKSVLPKVDTDDIKDKAVTTEKLSDDVIVQAKPDQFSGWEIETDSLSPSSSIQTEQYFRCRKGLQAAFLITGSVDSISFSIGTASGLSQSFSVTSANLVRSGNSYPHGLTLGTITTVVVDMGDDKNITSNTSIRIIDDSGHTFVKDGSSIDMRLVAGYVKVTNNNSSGNVGVKIHVFNKDLNKKVWIYGDSYLSYIDPARWTNHIMNWGYTNYFLSAQGGKTATEMYSDLLEMLTSGARPSYLLWCLGMNGGSDNNGEVNTEWMGVTNNLIALCQAMGTTLVFGTIPSTPLASHVALNEWIRSSGYRYVDFAKAVEDPNQGGTNYWRLWGNDTSTPASGSLLSSDKTHPTQYGAVELASRVMLDFPEISHLT